MENAWIPLNPSVFILLAETSRETAGAVPARSSSHMIVVMMMVFVVMMMMMMMMMHIFGEARNRRQSHG